jgi:hypothetical protein
MDLPKVVLYAEKGPARVQEPARTKEGPVRKHARLDTEAPIPVRVRRACILEELFKAQAQVELATKRAEELHAQLLGLVDDDDAEVKEEL